MWTKTIESNYDIFDSAAVVRDSFSLFFHPSVLIPEWQKCIEINGAVKGLPFYIAAVWPRKYMY